MTRQPLIKFSIFLVTLFIISACVTSPTGRNQLLLFSDSQLAVSGEQAFTSMKAKQKIATTEGINEYVLCIANAITAQTNYLPQDQWEVVIFEDDNVNAFALPGGKIGVYTGLLAVAENQHQVAAVIGHEVGHVMAQHGNERMSQNTLIGIGSQAVAQILVNNEVAETPVIMGALGLGLQVGVALPYSRTHESEADLIGLDLMARAGFDPRQSVNLWVNMAGANDKELPPEFLSTHPLPSTRIDMLNNNMSKAMALYNLSPTKPQCKI